MDNKSEQEKIYFVTGGGTGGHIYPALAVIKELKELNVGDIFYVGNPKNPEAKLADENGLKFLPVNVSGMPRKISLTFFLWLFKLIFAIITSLFYVIKYKPTLVFGTGGYVSAPILFAAKLLKVPYALHDADAQPGIVTRCFASGAKFLTTPFEEVKTLIPSANVGVTGNPIRDGFSQITKEDAHMTLKLENKLTLLIMGGSQGARSINVYITPILKKLIEEFNINIIHQTGKRNFDETKELLDKYFSDYIQNKNYRLLSYIDDMPTVLKACDIAISRSGSLSLSEMKAAGVASILIPYPFAAGNHQKKNAQAMVNLGCSLMIEEKNLTSDKLYETLSELIKNKNLLETMQKNAKQHSMPNAAKIIAGKLVEI